MKHRELWWLLVVVGVVAMAFYQVGRGAAPVSAPSPTPVVAAGGSGASTSPADGAPHYRGPLSRAQFSLEMLSPYGAHQGHFKFHARGNRTGARVEASMRQEGRTVTAEVDLDEAAWRAFFVRLEDRGAWTLRSAREAGQPTRTRYEVYLQAADWSHRAVFERGGDDPHAEAFLVQGLAGTVLDEQYQSLQRALFPDAPSLQPQSFPPAESAAAPSSPAP